MESRSSSSSGTQSSEVRVPRKVKRSKNKQKRKSDQAINTQDTLDVYFIAWESAGVHFLNRARFAVAPKNLRVHVFYSKGTPLEELPKAAKWIVGHESLTHSKEAMWVDITAYITSFYARIAAEAACKHKRDANRPKLNLNLICNEDDRGKELVAVLKANKIDIRVINGRKQTFLDMFPNACRPCKIIFETKTEAELHDKQYHNFLCHNTQCERSRRGNGYYLREELEKHLRAQKFCKYCPSDVFCSSQRYQQHVRDNHKSCPCPCDDFFERKEDFMEHFYARYPLPCLEEPACDSRFRDIEGQAFHHKTAHGAKYPYYCFACFKHEKLVCLKTAEELLSHADESEHKESDFKFAIIPPDFLEDKLTH